MKVLYISDRRMGGIVNHVKCLTACLPPEVERYVIGEGGDEPFAGKSGHDIREWFQIRRVIRAFKPDVIHFNTIPLFMALYVKFRRLLDCWIGGLLDLRLFGLRLLDCWIGGLLDLRLFGLRLSDRRIGRRGKSNNQTIQQSNNQTIAVVCAIHTPSGAKKVAWDRALLNWAIEPCYWLPVSGANWRNFKTRYPKAKGEVFFNPVRIERGERLTDCRIDGLTDCRIDGLSDCLGGRGQSVNRAIGQSVNFIVGMVGRNAEQKDWPSFHAVEEKVKRRFSDCLISDCLIGGRGTSNNPTISNPTISRRTLAEGKVDEWLRGVTRESFVAALEALVDERSAIGEYRFKRDLEKELALEGAKRFFDEFSRKIIDLSDGRCVYFAPDVRSKNRNSNDLSRCWAEYAFHAVSNGGVKLIGKDYHERWYNPYKNANMDLIEPVLLDEQCVPVLKRNSAADAIKFFGKTHDQGNFDVVTRLDECGNAGANMTEVTFEASTKKIKSPRLVPLAEAVQTVVSHQTTAGSYPPDGSNISNPSAVDNPPQPSQSNNPTISNPTISTVEFLNAGEKGECDGREAIRKMDLFVMTSKHEELPTTVLECFMLGTPICGFVPRGGMSDILEFSQGPLKEAFIEERDCEKLSEIVIDLIAHPEKRQAIVEDGRQILEGHFDAEKNVKGQLMRVYENCLI